MGRVPSGAQPSCTASAVITLGAPMASALAEEMRSAGVGPTRLRARPYGGSGSLRTDDVGWYVRRDRRADVGTDGRWYALIVAPSLRGRLAGVHLEPTDAPLQVGAGGRDRRSVALEVLLRLRLDAGPDFLPENQIPPVERALGPASAASHSSRGEPDGDGSTGHLLRRSFTTFASGRGGSGHLAERHRRRDLWSIKKVSRERAGVPVTRSTTSVTPAKAPARTRRKVAAVRSARKPSDPATASSAETSR